MLVCIGDGMRHIVSIALYAIVELQDTKGVHFIKALLVLLDSVVIIVAVELTLASSIFCCCSEPKKNVDLRAGFQLMAK